MKSASSSIVHSRGQAIGYMHRMSEHENRSEKHTDTPTERYLGHLPSYNPEDRFRSWYTSVCSCRCTGCPWLMHRYIHINTSRSTAQNVTVGATTRRASWTSHEKPAHEGYTRLRQSRYNPGPSTLNPDSYLSDRPGVSTSARRVTKSWGRVPSLPWNP